MQQHLDSSAIYTLPDKIFSEQLENIYDFFTTYHIADASNYIHHLLMGIKNGKRCRKRIMKDASNNLFFCKQLSGLLENALQLLSKDPRASCGRISFEVSDDFFLQAFLYTKEPRPRHWNSFPRHLERKQIIRPMLALRKFYKKMPLHDWKEFLEELLHINLSCSNEYMNIDEYNYYELHHLLCGVVEACYLLYIRSHQNFPAELDNYLKTISQLHEHNSHAGTPDKNHADRVL